MSTRPIGVAVTGSGMAAAGKSSGRSAIHGKITGHSVASGYTPPTVSSAQGGPTESTRKT